MWVQSSNGIPTLVNGQYVTSLSSYGNGAMMTPGQAHPYTSASTIGQGGKARLQPMSMYSTPGTTSQLHSAGAASGIGYGTYVYTPAGMTPATAVGAGTSGTGHPSGASYSTYPPQSGANPAGYRSGTLLGHQQAQQHYAATQPHPSGYGRRAASSANLNQAHKFW